MSDPDKAPDRFAKPGMVNGTATRPDRLHDVVMRDGKFVCRKCGKVFDFEHAGQVRVTDCIVVSAAPIAEKAPTMPNGKFEVLAKIALALKELS